MGPGSEGTVLGGGGGGKTPQSTHDTVITVRLYISRLHCHSAQVYAAKMPHRCSDSLMNSVTNTCMSRTYVLFL